MKRVLLFVVLTATSVGAAVAFAQSPQPKPYKVVFDLTSADQADQRAVLRWIKEVTSVNPKTETEVVMYARGLDLVVSGKSTMASEVAEAITDGTRHIQRLRDRDEESAGRLEKFSFV